MAWASSGAKEASGATGYLNEPIEEWVAGGRSSEQQTINGRRSKLYALLPRLPWPKSYLGKLMLITFLGIHVPLIAFVLYLVFAAPTDLRAFLSVLVIVLVATLFGTVLTLCALYALLRPVSLASKALYEYLDSGRMPSLPTNFTDQAGRLMANVQYVI